jgi:poly(hydroxyalkanoate) depolymerase family esterase
MAEATRLTREGRIAEATALIQRTLGGVSAAAPVEARVRVVEETPPRVGASMKREGPASARYSGQHEQTVRPGGVPPSANPGGRFIDEAFSNAAARRTYKLYVPRSYTGQAVPLVVMLHGCTQSSVDFATGTRMNTFAEGKAFLVAYPEQASSANNSKCWNWFQPTDQQGGKGEPSLIAGITRQIMNSYNVDVERVYVAGMSAGGAMAVIMAASYPDLYAAVGVHSGLAYQAAHDISTGFAAMRRGTAQSTRRLATAIPLIAFHGDLDTTVSPLNADHLLDQWLRAHERGGSALAARVERGQAANGRAYTRSIYDDTGGRTFAEKWLIHQAGHAWSGGNPAGSFTDPQGPDASGELLRFFFEHARKG